NTRIRLDREQEIAELAEFVADEYCPTGRVEPLEILKRKEISHSFGFYGNYFDGMLECKGGRFHVFSNLQRVENAASPRARFTLAHEIGHYFIDEHRNALLSGTPPHGSRCDFESKNLVEREADTFASQLLLPATRFRAEAKRAAKGLAGILSLGRTFDTSISSTAIRYVRDDIIPCTVIKWNHDGMGWRWFSPTTFNEAGFRKVIDDRKRLPSDSATELVFSGTAPDVSGFI